MVAEARTWVDVEGAVRAWARDEVASVNRRVFYGANNQAAMPQIVLFRIGGPDDQCLIQFDVWAKTKDQAAAAAAELCTAADDLSRYVAGNVLLTGAVVDGSRWQPDEDDDIPRYIVEITFSAWAAS
jgi:hypothetical protein